MKKTRRTVRLILPFSIAVWCVLASFLPAQAAPTFTVNSTIDAVDANPGNGVCATSGSVCTLRAAIMEANHTPGGGATISLPAGTYTLAIPKSGLLDETTGDLDIAASMNIVGAGASSTVIDGNRSITRGRVFLISTGSIVNISGVAIHNGDGIEFGGGILNSGTLTLANSVVSGNLASYHFDSRGGGILNFGILTLIASEVSGNSAINCGGIEGGDLTIINSTISDNRVIGFGGGICGHSNSTIIESTVSNNHSSSSGGGIIFGNGTLRVINSTVSGNSASDNGGGIYIRDGSVSVFSSTITNNIANNAGYQGIGGGVFNNSGTFNFQNTILAGNLVKVASSLEVDDCAGTIASNGNNLMENYDTSHCTVVGIAPLLVDPELGPLRNNGGPTQTHALLAGSPAIDAGDILGCRDNLGALILRDQRGFSRTVDGDQSGPPTCDIGAYEFGAGTAGPVDFDRDGRTDVAVYQSSAGNWFVVESSTGFFRTAVNFGGSDFLPVPGDYDGDGKTDVAVYQQSTGNWFVVGTTSGFFTPALNFGGVGFIPVPGDYDGDGETDAAVYQQSTGNWFAVGTTTGFFSPALNFGGTGFIPVPGDYDGDGKTDAAVYQSSTGNWFAVGSTSGFFTPALSFGGSGFIPVPGDFDGDGKTDAGVYQSSTGNWFFVGSTSGFHQVLNFGGPGFTPVAGDYDGDGKTDAAVYGTATGNWFVVGMTTGFFSPALNFGGPGFVPVLPQVTILRALGLL